MKHLNEYKIFENKEDIDVICKKYGIHNYTINDDGSIDVDDNVYFYNKVLIGLPLKFNRVSGNFYCNDNKLTSLEGSPKYVGGSFYCNRNNLTSLEGGPEYIDSNFYFNGNKITSLEGYPEHVGGNIYYGENPVYRIVRYFIDRCENRDSLIELFNYYDIIQGMNVIYDRLKFFYEGIDIKVTDNMLKYIEDNGYKIIK